MTDRGAKVAGSVVPYGRNKVLDALYSYKGRAGFAPAPLDALEIETGLSRGQLLTELLRLKRKGFVEELTT